MPVDLFQNCLRELVPFQQMPKVKQGRGIRHVFYTQIDSSKGVPWIDRAIELVRPHAGEITLGGDTDFTLTGGLDRWDQEGIKFIFAMDAHPKVVALAESLSEKNWER